MRHFITVAFMLLLVIIISCEEEDDEVISTSPVVADSTLTVDLAGYVQKGPFINGTAVTLSEMNAKLTATGKNFTTQIVDSKGSFSLKEIPLTSPYVQLQATGFYFDEVKGEKSAAPLSLFALSEVTDISTVNVNLLSYLEYSRVIYLMQEEKSTFEDAKKKAQQEILDVFGIEKEEMQHSELLDISQDGDDNAILLAVSAVLQANNTVAELSELIANLITDLREDGTLHSQATREKLKTQATLLNLPQIRANLEKRYEDMGIDATIPNFEQYIDSDGDGILNKDEDDNPDDFTFTLQKDVAVRSKVTSNAVKISGLKEGGTANAVVRKGNIVLNGHISSDSVIQVKNGDALQLQLTSSQTYVDTVKATLSIGTVVKHFQVITDDYVPDAFSFKAQKDVAIDSFYTSNTITVSGIPYPTPLQIEGGVLIKNGEALPTDTTSVKNGDELTVRLFSSSEYAAPTNATLDINGVRATFNLITDDYAPDTFSFKKRENVWPDITLTSDTIILSGLKYPAPISVDAGQLFINGQKVHNIGNLVKEGDMISVQLQSSEEYLTTASVLLTIGSEAYEFKATTYQNPWERKADFPGITSDFSSPGFTINGKLYYGLAGVFVNHDKDTDGFYDGILSSRNFYEYDPITNVWTKKADFPGSLAPQALAFSVQGRGYFLLTANNPETEFWEYDPILDSWTQLPDFPGTASMYPQYAFTVNNKVYIGSGYESYASTSINEFWEFNPVGNSWVQKNNYPFEFTGHDHWRDPVNCLEFDGKGYILSNGEYNIHPVYEYDPTSDKWSTKINSIKNEDVPLSTSAYTFGLLNSYNGWDVYQFNYHKEIWTKIKAPYVGNVTINFFVENRVYSLLQIHNNGHLVTEFWEYTPPVCE